MHNIRKLLHQEGNRTGETIPEWDNWNFQLDDV